MALPALVLVHGGGLAADSWQLTVDEIRRQAPELSVLAVDLPGRRGKPGDLLAVTIADFVDSVVGDIEAAGLGEIVIVGHSMAGLYPESPHILAENVSRRGMPDDIPRAWILTMRDRALSIKLQRKAIDAIGGVQTLIEMNTCHMLMVSEPKRLAEILVDRCRLNSR